MRPILFNGKFLSARPTGVHRVAEELIRAVDTLLEERDELEAVLIHPRDIVRRPTLRRISQRRVGRSTWQVWEQGELPLVAGPGLLVNLCNLGPVMRRDAITMIHDAQVIESPQSYAPLFRAYYRAVQPVIARRHRAVVTVSDYARDALVRHGVAPSSAITVIPNGVDHVTRTPPDRTAARAHGLTPGRYVLAPATAQAHKNVAMLIDAFRRPELATTTLALFGDTPLAEIDRYAPANVAALGRVSDAALFGLMEQAAAFACPSLTEGFGLPPLEAMAVGAPVVAAPRGALPETCGDAAIYVDPDDPGAWAETLGRLADWGPLRRQRAEEGLAHAQAFTWERSARKLLRLIDEVEGRHCAA